MAPARIADVSNRQSRLRGSRQRTLLYVREPRSRAWGAQHLLGESRCDAAVSLLRLVLEICQSVPWWACGRLLRPLLEADKPPAKIEIRRALNTLENAVTDYIQNARLTPAA